MTTFTVLNKADHLDAAGLAETAEFTRQVLAQAARSSGTPGAPGAPGRIYPLSARAELAGGDPGFAAFAADFTAYLASSRVADLQVSAVLRARRIARSLLDEVALTRRAAQLAAGEAADRVTRFGERLAEVAIRGQDAVAVASAESARLLKDLNAAAEADGRRLGRDIARQLEETLGGELRTATAAEIERQGRERLVGLTVAAASAWRARRRDIIEQGLARTDARLAADLTAALGELRDSAAELLGLELLSRSQAAGSPRTAASSTPRPTRPARPSCWPPPSAASSLASLAAAAPASTCCARLRAWWRARSAGPEATSSTGCPRQPARSPGPWSGATRRQRAGCGPPCVPPGNSVARRWLMRRRKNEICPNGSWRFATRSPASTRRAARGSDQRPSISPCRTAGGARRRRSRSAGCIWRSAHHAPGRRT